MAGPVTVPLGPAIANLTGVRANDRNLLTATLSAKGSPIDLTGVTVTAQARLTPNTPDPAAIEADITVIDAAAGKIEIRWPGDQVSAALGTNATWTGVWDLQIVYTGEDPVTVVAGSFAAEMDVTR